MGTAHRTSYCLARWRVPACPQLRHSRQALGRAALGLLVLRPRSSQTADRSREQNRPVRIGLQLRGQKSGWVGPPVIPATGRWPIQPSLRTKGLRGGPTITEHPACRGKPLPRPVDAAHAHRTHPYAD